MKNKMCLPWNKYSPEYVHFGGGWKSKNKNTLSYFWKEILVQHQKCINVYSHTNRSKKTYHMIINRWRKNIYYNLTHLFMMKNNLSKPGIEGNILNLMKDIYQKSMANSRFNDTSLEALLFKSEKSKDFCYSVIYH